MHQKTGSIFFAAFASLLWTLPALAQGPMPPCAYQAISAAEELASADEKNGIFENINNVVLTENNESIVWKIFIRESSTQKTLIYRVKASLPECKINAVRLIGDFSTLPSNSDELNEASERANSISCSCSLSCPPIECAGHMHCK